MPLNDSSLPNSASNFVLRTSRSIADVALLLAAVNIYALSAFAVVQRHREIGIRVALGATAASAMRFVMQRGLAWIGTGLAAGSVASLILAAPLLQQRKSTRRAAPTRMMPDDDTIGSRNAAVQRPKLKRAAWRY